jgi:beta-galactosidase
VVDAKGNPVRTNNIELNAEVEGDIRLLNQSPITTSWGEGALLIEIGETLKNAEITVTAKGLKPATLSLEK